MDVFLPDAARIEYRLEIRRGHLVETTLDPDNPDVASNPFGVNSVLVGSNYAAALRCQGRWQIEDFRIASSAFGGRRQHRLLSPTGVAPDVEMPLVVLHDGSDYLAHAGIDQVLACGLEAGALPPVRLVLLDPRRRNVEYAADARHAIHVTQEVLPRLRERVAVGSRVVAVGASLGAVASWHAAWTHPGVFNGLVLQSGTFAFGSHSEIPPTMAASLRSFLDLALDEPRTDDVDIGQSCGRYESLIDWNRQVAALLERRAKSHRYRETWTGHDWGAWADVFLSSLAFVLGAPSRAPGE